MHDNTAFIGVLAGLMGLAGFVPYFLSMRRGKASPNRATWWIWCGVGFMLMLTSYQSGIRHGIWIPVAYFIGTLVIALFSFKYGQGGQEATDLFCLMVAAASIFLWYFTGSAKLAMAANLVADGIGCWPTLKKAYAEPEGEDRLAWGIWLSANTLNLFAVQHWTFAGAAYPVYMAVACAIITSVVFFHPRRTAP